MSSIAYGKMITRLPEADIPFTAITGWLAQGDDHQVVFFDIEPDCVVPPHSHGEQWGIVVEGEMHLTIGGETGIYRQGDSYHVPEGVEHSATFVRRCRVIDVFADNKRYKPKTNP